MELIMACGMMNVYADKLFDVYFAVFDTVFCFVKYRNRKCTKPENSLEYKTVPIHTWKVSGRINAPLSVVQACLFISSISFSNISIFTSTFQFHRGNGAPAAAAAANRSFGTKKSRRLCEIEMRPKHAVTQNGHGC